MRGLRLALPIVAALVLVGCGTPIAAVPAPMQAPTCRQLATSFINQVESLAHEWDQVNKLAGRTTRISLAAPHRMMQSMRRRVQDLNAPACALPVKQHLVDALDQDINGYLAVLTQKSN